ncbi:uncharacterized protein Dana_GF15126, isoform C [Drosophila ananassae]|uniref:Uncharacterized protein, isoform C n=1 Tax=Drosophila ananassae TaxID=7217 RepID=A0A0P9A3P3_DROAN|nr:kinesin-like protein KIN-7I isoform X2 [Drosophila ananassae]KPU73173.1 uncharacterized protein Dana_GF15126, isoform C [Drosophila ananassae]
MSAKGSRSIQVAIKVRPCEPGLSRLWLVKEGRSIQLTDSHAEPCVFDYVFDEGASNQEVFDRMAKHIVHACMQGFNGTIFAYGQTSSGKTYTMMGDNKNPGVMVLAAKEIFRQISEEKDRDFLLRVGYIEIYNEKIYDLLDKKNQDLKIHELGNGMVNVNCEECIITCEDDLLRLLSMGNKERTVGETNMNERSSRSHAIFRIIIESRKSDRAEDDAVNQSVLNLVDLAGSERADQTGATGARLKEGGHINKSLLFLSNVIKNLAERESESGAEQSSNKFISFRDSKLTRILQASLGGNAFTSIICTIKPSILEESQSTLSFAMRAKKIKTKPQLNEMVSDATMMKRLEREIKDLKDRLAEEERKNESQLKVQELERCIKRDMLKIISSTSLSDKRLQKRRRTWCPGPEKNAEAQQETGAGLAESSHLPPLSKLSHLPKPTFFPTSHISGRLDKAPKTINILQSLALGANESRIDEEFLPADCIDFDAVPPAVQKAKLHSMLLPLTPVASEMKGATCEALQTEVSALKTDNLEASDKIKGYEEQLKAMKETMARLEVENRDAVTLEFQFKSQKERSAQREKDLLSALSEKDAAIEDLKKSLDEMTLDLRNSKEDFMRSMCQPAESQVCHKCDELEETLLRSSNFEKQCQQLEADNKRLQAEMDSLKENFEVAQRQLTEFSKLESLAADCKAENESLKKQITELQASYDEIQREYDCLSNQLMESVQENDALREELKLRPLSGMESMKSSGVGMESSVYEPDLSGEFARISESVHQIEVQLNSGSSRIFRAMKLENKQDQGLHRLKLCMESAKYVEDVGSPTDSADSTVLKGLIKQHRFQIIRSSEELVEERSAEVERLLAIISQLQDEIKEKNDLLKDELMNINEMREQITTLESALLEKSVIVNKVEDYQRQIECLEKQNAEISLVCEELQEKALRDSTLCESILRADDTLPMPAQLESEEVTALKESLEELKAKVIQFQGELDNQLKQLQLKNENIEQLQAEIQELNERCLSMDVRQVELQLESDQKQQQLDRQALKLAEDRTLIDKLQESNANLLDRSIKAEKSVAELQERLSASDSLQDQGIIGAELEKELNELREQLLKTREDLKSKSEQINDLQLEYLQKLETCESENRANFRRYNLEWEESRDKYESTVATLKEQLEQTEQALAEMNDNYQTEKGIKGDLEIKLQEAELQQKQMAERNNAELERIRGILQQRSEEQAQVDVIHAMELETIRTALKEQRTKAEEDREKQVAEVEDMRSTLTEVVAERNEKYEKILELEKLKKEQDVAVDLLKKEVRELEKSQKLVEQLQTQLKAREEDNSDRVIAELQEKNQTQSIELESLMKEKEALILKLEDAVAQEASTSQCLQEVQLEVESLVKEKESQKSEMEEKIKTLKAKISDLEKSLQKAQEKDIEQKELLNRYEDLIVSFDASQEAGAVMEETVDNLKSQLEVAQEEVTRRDLDVESLRKELEFALQARESICSEKESLLKQLQELENEMTNQANKFQKEVSDLEGSVGELNLKMKSLQEQKDELEAGNEEMKVKLKNSQNLQFQLEEERKIIVQLQESCLELEKQLQAKDAEFSSKSDEFSREMEVKQQTINELGQQCEKLRAETETKSILESQIAEERKLVTQLKESHMQLEEQLRAKEADISHRSKEISQEMEQGRRSLGELTQEYQKLRLELETKTSTFEKEKEKMDLNLTKLSKENKEMVVKLRSLEETNNANIKLVNDLKTRIADNESIRESFSMELEVAKKKLLEMNQSAQVLTSETEKLRSALKTKESSFRSEKDRMDGTISSLLEDKRNLEEKVCNLNEILKKLEAELAIVHASGLKANGSNLSFDSNASTGSVASTTAPVARKSLDRNTGAPLPRKSMSSELEIRRNRRISVHDENRRHSYWNDVRESSTMTDPVDSNCSCAELNSKLETCQRELFIRESQVTALNLELKHHPLKEENAQLKKRIMVEQEKARTEQRRLKQKIHDLTIKINDLSEKCGLSATGQAISAKPSVVSTQTQTESELEKVIEETTKKYQETVRLCRFRAGIIKDLEEKLKQNENVDTSNICSLTNGQISSLKAQCESQKKEMLTLREKYEAAKKVLQLRKDEILELRAKVSGQTAK